MRKSSKQFRDFQDFRSQKCGGFFSGPGKVANLTPVHSGPFGRQILISTRTFNVFVKLQRWIFISTSELGHVNGHWSDFGASGSDGHRTGQRSTRWLICDCSLLNPDAESCMLCEPRNERATRWFCFILCVFLTGCEPAGFHERDTPFLPLDTPDLSAQLGITTDDWQALQKLSSEEKDYVAFGIAKGESGGVDIEYSLPDDKMHDKGGPFYHFEKRNGVWTKDGSLIGYWAGPVYLDTANHTKPTASPTQQAPQD